MIILMPVLLAYIFIACGIAKLPNAVEEIRSRSKTSSLNDVLTYPLFLAPHLHVGDENCIM